MHGRTKTLRIASDILQKVGFASRKLDGSSAACVRIGIHDAPAAQALARATDSREHDGYDLEQLLSYLLNLV